jgi:hypothetical protein
MEEELNEVYLCFIRLIGEENDGYYRYEFIFTDNPDEVWGEDWEHKPIGLINNPIPSDDYLTEIHIVKTKIKFDLIQNNMCFSMQDCLDGIVALAWQNIDELDAYPEDGRIYFMFGESLEDVERKLALKNVLMLN